MRLVYLLLVALLALFVTNQGPLLHHHEHHPAAHAPAALSFPSSLGSSSFVELDLPSSSSSSAAAAIFVRVQAKSLAGTGFHFLVLQSDGTVFATGLNGAGQLATGTTKDALAPQKANATGVVDVAAGMQFSCLVMDSTIRQVQCVGTGTFGQLGRNSTDGSSVLKPVWGALGAVVEVFCGPSSSFAVVLGSGQVYAWGNNANRQLGIGNSSNHRAPALVDLPIDFNATQVGAGQFHSCFLSSLGEVRCAGVNYWGQLGDDGGVSGTTASTPVAVNVSLLSSPGTTKFVSLAAGAYHTCATATDNKVYCWGHNTLFQLGTTVGDFQNKPTPVDGITNARSVWAGLYNTYVIDNNLLGSGAVAFGRDAYGVFGSGTVPPGYTAAVPMQFGQNVTGIVELRGGFHVTCILKQPGEVWCTGNNSAGQFGKGDCLTTSTLLVEWGTPCTSQPTLSPTSSQPTLSPTSSQPTYSPTSSQPTYTPTSSVPTQAPTSSQPTNAPTSSQPTGTPTHSPTSSIPSRAPSTTPVSSAPSNAPSKAPVSSAPSDAPSNAPSKAPTSAPVSGAPTSAPVSGAPTSAPVSSAPSSAPISRVPTTSPVSTTPTTAPVSTAPTAAPIVSTSAPTPPANPICRPVIGTKKADCTSLGKTCAKSKVTVLWAGAGCRVNGKLQHDGGCQCKDYCGYTCSKACNLSSGGKCKWNNMLKVCTAAKTGKPYVPRDTAYCPRD